MLQFCDSIRQELQLGEPNTVAWRKCHPFRCPPRESSPSADELFRIEGVCLRLCQVRGGVLEVLPLPIKVELQPQLWWWSCIRWLEAHLEVLPHWKLHAPGRGAIKKHCAKAEDTQ